ncbi:MAG: hypothetical protein SGJ20_16420 [Planctomycetota bacterium]|nr:hypothetical protein [Planctomycetota bacterium]
MAKFLAVEWDNKEIRLVIARQRGNEAVLEQAKTIPLANSSGTAQSITKLLQDALNDQQLKRLECLATVGRPDIELKDLSLPPAPDHELPDMVRFQALRDFTHLGDDWPIDFIPLPGSAEEQRSVMTGAISPTVLAEITQVFTAVDLKLQHLVLRPCAAASLLARRRPQHSQVRMLVDMLGDEVDLTVLVGDTPIFMRTARLPADSRHSESARPLIGEIRRTIAAVHNRLHDRRVEAVVLCGNGLIEQSLSEQIRQEINLPVELFDPFAEFGLEGGLERKLPADRSRFVPLLGLIAGAAAQSRHDMDFLDPRRPPVPRNYRRELAAAAALVGVLLLAFIGWTWWSLSELDAQILATNDASKQLDAKIKQVDQLQKEMGDIEKWMSGDIAWLDVLHDVSTNAPKAQEAMLRSLNGRSSDKSGGTITLEGMLSKQESFSALEQRMRDNYRQGTVREINRTSPSERYPWNFKADMAIETALADTKKPVAPPPAKSSPTSPKVEKKSDSPKVPPGKQP